MTKRFNPTTVRNKTILYYLKRTMKAIEENCPEIEEEKRLETALHILAFDLGFQKTELYLRTKGFKLLERKRLADETYNKLKTKAYKLWNKKGNECLL